MTIAQQIITIVAVVLRTMTTRFLPFLIFRRAKIRRMWSATWELCFPMQSSAF